MAKYIKRVGIIFFALVISCLLLVGMGMTLNVSERNDEVSFTADTEDDNNETTAAITEYLLKGSCKEMGDLWNKAAQESINTKKTVKVILQNDWIAEIDENTGYHTFYAGVGNGNFIRIPVDSHMILDLNGYNIDKGLFGTDGESEGFLIRIWGTLDLIDNKYDYDKIWEIYNNYGANETQFLTALRNTNMGKLTGGCRSANSGGAIIVDGGTLNMYGGIIIDNYARNGGAGIAYNRDGYTYIYDGVIANNTASYGAGIAGSNITIENVLVCYNKATNYGGGIWGNSIKLNGGLVVRNSSGNYAGGFGLAAIAEESIIGNAIVAYNTSVNNSAGVYFPSSAILTINAGANVYNNKLSSNVVSNVEIRDGSIIHIGENLLNKDKTTFVGITLSDNFEGNIFTQGFTSSGNTALPSKSFFSDVSDKIVTKSGNEVALTNGITPQSTINWQFTDGITQKQNYMSKATVVYTGKPYVVSAGGISKIKNGNGIESDKFTCTNAGSYSFYVDSTSYLNPTFTLIIRPMQLDLDWQTELVYNGKSQTPKATAIDLDGNILTASIKGEQTDPGKFIANAVSLNNSNYSIKPSSLFKTIIINRKPIDIPKNDNQIMVYNNTELEYKCSGFDENLMKFENNIQKNVGKYTAKLLLKDSTRYVWKGGSDLPVEFAFEIIHPGIVLKDNSEFDYIYLDSNFRKGYKENDLSHRVNDSEKTSLGSGNRYVIGNIPTNTTLSSFINNIRNESKLLKVYDNQGDKIFDGLESNGIIADSVVNTLVGTGYKIELYESISTSTPWDIVYLSVLGDINGDGRITASDVAEVREVAENNALLNSMPLEKKLACMVDNKGSVTYVDSEILRNTINNQLDVNLFFESGINVDSEYKYLTLDKDNLIRGTSEIQTNVIGNIEVNTSLATFKEKLAVLGIDTTAITIYDRKGSVVTDENVIVGTGWSIVTGGKTIYLSVIGDINGDGRISAVDITMLRELVTINNSDIADYVLLSAIVLNKGGITTADSEVLRVVVNGLLDISKY